MPEQETAQTTPLQNLFYYIRDLYNASDPCYEFEKESNNSKTENIDYWKISNFILLAQQSVSKGISEFSFNKECETETSDYILKVKRISIPSEPQIPNEIVEWTVLNRSSDIPTLSFKKELDILEKFEQSAQRVKDLEKYKHQSHTALFDLPIPSSLEGWITLADHKILRKAEKKIIVLFAADENKKKVAKSFQTEFDEYYAKFAIPIRINKVYDALHKLNYELKGKDTKRLYISFGLLSGLIGNQRYQNFLFHVPLKLSLKNQEITIQTDTFSNKIFSEQYFVDLLNTHFKSEHASTIEQRRKEIILSIDNFNSKPQEFIFDADFIRTEFYDVGLQILNVFSQKKDVFFKGENLNCSFEKPSDTNQITFSFSPVIQTKVVESQITTAKDANNIINQINRLEATGTLYLIPDFFKKLFSLDGHENETEQLIGENGFTTKSEKYTGRFEGNASRFLFPLPYNEEQLEIAKRLDEQDAVTVKGPPGTGKSHTIANVISHFVAQGRSILVVSHNAKALSVLKEKLPSAIRDLAVSLVNEGKGNESLRGSVNAIIRNLSQRYQESKVADLETELSNLEKKYADTLNEIYKVVQANNKSFKIYNPYSKQVEEKTAYEWAIFLFENNNYTIKFVKDNIAYNTDTNGLVEKLSQLAALGNHLTVEDSELINYYFLPAETFLGINELRDIETKLTEIIETINIPDYESMQPSVLTEKIKRELDDFEKQYNKFEELSIPEVIYKHPNYSIGLLKNILKQNEDVRAQVHAIDNKLISFRLDLAAIEVNDPDILYQQINQLILKFGDNNTLSWFTKGLLDKNLKRFFECKVNFNPAVELEHFKIIEDEINKRRCLKQLSITFNNYLNSFGIPDQKDIREALKELDFTAEFASQFANLNAQLAEKGLPQLPKNPSQVKSRLVFLKNIKYYGEYKTITNFLKNIKSKLTEHSKPHPLIHKIADAVESVNRSLYELSLESYLDKKEKQIQAFLFDKLSKEASLILPLTTAVIRDSSLSEDSFLLDKEVLEEDIFFLKLTLFLTSITNHTKGSDKLLLDLQALKRGMEKQTAEIISYKTWYHKSKQVSNEEKSALTAWLNSLIDIGKGYGKNTARNIAAATRYMQVAKGAVPIWIMTKDNALTFFPDANPNQFDLLIIDEASQCDISSLNLVFRCKKSLIVGDENQTSVISDRSTFTIERTNQMLDKYLISHKFKTQFDVNNKNNSIYTISGVIYPNIVMLTEHFRCLPEIIGYSNRYMYNDDIIPLKTATEKIYGEPLAIYYVEDNHLDETKQLIVKKVVEEIERYIVAYQEGRLKKLPTIGIITLDSTNTKHQSLLLRQLSQSVLISQYEDQLGWTGDNAKPIGTSRDFQGDERDIMFLTITASHSISEKNGVVEIKPPRVAASEENMRIFNVAASRAKEKSVVIHSIHPDAVGVMNPDCYRKKLIDYYTNSNNRNSNTTSIRTLQSLCDKTDANSGDFEKSVCKLLYNNGLGDYLFPQFEVGKHRIDFGLIKNNKKLAIECDGFAYHSGIEKIQEDINRQLILERAGWRFFRIQSTDWFYRNAIVSSDLLQWINENTTIF